MLEISHPNGGWEVSFRADAVIRNHLDPDTRKPIGAVDYASKGTALAGGALQEAGKALIAAGNAVNTVRGTDTAVNPA